MAIKFSCPRCGQSFTVPEKHAGKRARCNDCASEFTIPPAAAAVQRPSAEPHVPTVTIQEPAASVTVPAESPVATAVQPPAAAVAAPGAHVHVHVHANSAPPPAPAGQDLLALARRERNRRAAKLMMVGLIALVAFFSPWFLPREGGGYQPKFVGLEMVTASDTPLDRRLVFAYPLIAGLITFLLGMTMHNRIRGLILLALFAAPVVYLATLSPGAHRPKFMALTGNPVDTMRLMTTDAMLVTGGVLLLLVGLSARSYRPRWGWLYIISLAGAAGFAASLVWDGSRPQWQNFATDKNPLFVLYQALKIAPNLESQLVGGGMLAMYVLLALSALIALLDIPGLPTGGVRKITGLALIACRLGILLWIASLIYPTVRVTVAEVAEELKAGGTVDQTVMTFINLVKPILQILAIALLLPAGLVDFIIGAPPKPTPEQEYERA